MFTKKAPPWRCKACRHPVQWDTYYCKKCGALVSVELAPDAREIDTSLKTKLRRIWYARAVAKITWALIIVVAVASASYFFNTIRIARIDNHSSAIFKMKVDAPSAPLSCNGTVCQATVEIINKTKSAQVLQGVPYFKLDNGKLYGPINLAKSAGRLYFADKYCNQKFDLSFAASESQKFLGICTENLPRTGFIKGIQIRDGQGKVVLSADLQVAVPQKY